jgi:branched-chain amino acid transport system permease protein
MASVTLPSTQPARGPSPALVAISIIIGFALVAVFLRKVEGLSLGLVALAAAATAALPHGRNLARAALDSLRARAWWSVAASILGALLLPLFLQSDSYWIHVLTIAMIFAIMAVGLNIHLGEIGLVNLGYAGLFAIGAYSSTLLAQAGLPFLAATLLAMAITWLVGGFLGFCSVRTSGDYFALVTLGFGLIVQQLLINLTWLTKGNDGITDIPAIDILGHSSKSPIDLGLLHLPKEANFYYMCLLALCLSAALAGRYRATFVGRMWTALRQDPIGVSAFGLNVPRFKIQTVAFGSLFAGLAGSLFAREIGFISPDDFSLLQSVEIIAGVILGGIGNLFGAILGSVLLYIAPEKLRFLGDYRLLIYGLMLVIILVYRPLGLFSDPRRRHETKT